MRKLVLKRAKWACPRITGNIALERIRTQVAILGHYCFIALFPIPLGFGEIGSYLVQMVLTSTVVSLMFSSIPQVPSVSPVLILAAPRVPDLTSTAQQGDCLPLPLHFFSGSCKGSQLLETLCYHTSICVARTFPRAFPITIPFYLHNSTLWVKKVVAVIPHLMTKERKPGEENLPLEPHGTLVDVGVRTCLTDC